VAFVAQEIPASATLISHETLTAGASIREKKKTICSKDG
jgi:hypothetical protein